MHQNPLKMKKKVFSGNNQNVINVHTMKSQQIWFKSILWKKTFSTKTIQNEQGFFNLRP